ncbi:MAG TPA: hypothetical protein VGS23_05415 [Thermoplasmata archaeon]|nr:hypothetical protein [Thermoplasmata archaeon]
MTDPEVRTAAAFLAEHGVEYVVVGGQAVARTVPTGTKDVDVMVTTADFESTVAKLLKDPRIRLRGMREGLALLAIESAQGAAMDILDAAPFAGKRSGEEFFRFLVEKESIVLDGIRYATTPLVWYTRLLAARWKIYAEKILVNILDGADAGLLARAQEIARDFGTEAEIAPRLRYILQEIAERGPTGSDPR